MQKALDRINRDILHMQFYLNSV